MEPNILKEKVEWETRRVEAAFGVETFQRLSSEEHEYRGWTGDVSVWWDLRILYYERNGFIRLDYKKWFCGLAYNSTGVFGHTKCPSELLILLARGLYRLGLDDPNLLTRLNYPLSTHEKLELRLSMPREFWPRQWAEEENLIHEEH